MESGRTIAVQGTATCRQRPCLLLMVSSLQAAEPTLELALASLRRKREAATQWLERLQARSIEFANPRFPEQTEPDVMAAARQRTLAAVSATKPRGDGRKRVLVVYTATWSIEQMSAEEILVLSDRLQFESAADTSTDAEPEPTPTSWPPEREHLAQMLQQFGGDGADGDTTHFLFVSRLSEAQHQEAIAAAVEDARRTAKRIAVASGLQLGELHSINTYRNVDTADIRRKTAAMQRQQLIPLLSECCYTITPDEIMSENPAAVEFSTSVHATFSVT